METPRPSFSFRKIGLYRTILFLMGSTLMLCAPLVGLLPGPGGIVVFAIGLGLALRNSHWAKRRYVNFKRLHPKPGRFADWGMRRKSAKRRADRQKAAGSD